MDTRAKILDAAAFRGNGKPIKLVIGYFDPLHASHLRRLRELNTESYTLLVAVDNPPEPLLPVRARQELVAALSCVDFVIASADIALVTADEVVDERPGDLERRDMLVRQVNSKHSRQ